MEVLETDDSNCTITGLERGERYYANVIAGISDINNDDILRSKYIATYRPFSVMVGRHSSGNIVLLYIILGVVGAAFAVTFLLFGLYYCKYRRT
jgi:hypothetical protein